jgi:hypothetical protein
MKPRLVLIPCLGILLGGCISVGQSKMLVTPLGVAGIHSFAPQRTPDSMQAQQTRQQHLEAQLARVAP